MIEQYLGISSDYVIIGMAGVILLLFILIIVNMICIGSLRKRLKHFMKGKSGKSLEDTLILRLEQIDELIESNAANERNIDTIIKKMESCFQKYGLVKYDAFHEMGGKLSFTLAMLNEKNDGYILNAVHSREGCYTYVKEIIGGNSIVSLAEEEEAALKMALEEK